MNSEEPIVNDKIVGCLSTQSLLLIIRSSSDNLTSSWKTRLLSLRSINEDGSSESFSEIICSPKFLKWSTKTEVLTVEVGPIFLFSSSPFVTKITKYMYIKKKSLYFNIY